MFPFYEISWEIILLKIKDQYSKFYYTEIIQEARNAQETGQGETGKQ